MELKSAEKILETFAFMSVGLDKLCKELSNVEDLEERQELGPFIRDFLKSFHAFRDEIGFKHPDLHPDYLGIEAFAKMKQKFQLPDYPVDWPSQERIDKAIEFGMKMKNAKRK